MLGVGDPAFDAKSREVFRTTLAVDDTTWIRGKEWALSIALIIIPYYKESNPTLVAIAQRMIHELITDFTMHQ